MAEPSRRYRRLVEKISEQMIAGTRIPGANELDGLMIACDVSAAVLLELFDTREKRLAALDVFLTRLGNVLDRDEGKPN